MKGNINESEWTSLRQEAEKVLYPNDYYQFIYIKEDLVDCGYSWGYIRESLIDYLWETSESYGH